MESEIKEPLLKFFRETGVLSDNIWFLTREINNLKIVKCLGQRLLKVALKLIWDIVTS